MTPRTWLPNFFIAGAPKAGTSSLHQWIADHPDAFGSQEKETYFFVDPGTHMYRPTAHTSQGLDTWQAQFPIPDSAHPKVIVESTPSYIYSQTALREIPALPSQPKCLFILREPAAQIYSLYTYFRNNWDWIPSHMSFEDFLIATQKKSHSFKGNELAQNALEYAAYVDFLRKWKESLGADRIMVRSFDDLLTDQRQFVKDVALWIGLDPAFYESYEFPRENETYVPKNRTLQHINIAVRDVLPKGQMYNTLRRIYRKLNTRKKKPEKSTRDVDLLDALRKEYVSANAALAKEFGVTFKQVN